MTRTITPLFLFLLILLSVPCHVLAQGPMEALQQEIRDGIRVLNDPSLRKNAAEQQRKLWETALRIFDFEAFSKAVLGKQWRKFTLAQREEFVTVFGEFLGKLYLGKLQERYDNEQIIFLDEKMIGNTKAQVNIEVIRHGTTIPVKVRMTDRSGRWKVYDLSVLGINVVINYRAQFLWMLRRESPREIIGRLKNKIAALEKES